MNILIDINEMDLAVAIKSLEGYREYVKAILTSIETRKGGYDAAEALELLSKANAIERARYSLAHYQLCVIASEPANDSTMEETANG